MWKPNKRRIVLSAVGISLVLSVLLLSVFPFDSLLRKQFATVQEQARNQGVLLEAQGLDFSLPARIKASGLGIQFQSPDLYLPIFIDTGDISLRVFSSIFGSPEIRSLVQAYRGTLDATATLSPSKSSAHIVARLSDIELGEHPTVHYLGIEGLLSAQLDTVVSTKSPLSLRSFEGTLDCAIRKGFIQQPLLIAPLFSFPPAQDIALSISVDRRGDKLELTRVAMKSSLGKAAGRGYFVLDSHGVIIGMEINAIVNLSEEGHRGIGGYLALAGNESVDTSTRKWSIRLSQQPGYPLESLVKAKP